MDPRQGFSALALMGFGMESFLLWGYPGHWRLVGSIPDLPLDASSVPSVMTTKSVPKIAECLLGALLWSLVLPGFSSLSVHLGPSEPATGG